MSKNTLNRLVICQDWTELFTTPDGIEKLFRSIKIHNCKIDKIVSTHNKKERQRRIIVNVKSKTNNHLKKILIDAKFGEPSWKQMMDVTFGSGVDCNLRIVLFDGIKPERKPFDPGCDKDIAKSFALINNVYGVNTYVVAVIPFIDNGNVGVKFITIEKPNKYRKKKNPRHPSKNKFMRAEYWVAYHYYPSILHAQIVSDPQCWFDYQICEEFEDMGYISKWTEQGFFVEVIAESEDDKNLVQWVWFARRTDIMERYLGSKLISDGDEGPFLRLSIKILDMPFQDFNKLAPTKKVALADKIFTGGTDIHELFTKDSY